MLPNITKRYEILEWLGGGRFGDVYLVRDKLIDRKFALKVGRGGGNTEAFLEEARIISHLEHKNIIRFFTADIIDGRIVIVTEYIEGRTLREIIDRDAPLDPETALDYGKQLLSALTYAHKRGVIHRDLKPENIMVLDDGNIKVVDFGIARIGEGDLTVSIAGTPPYMAREVWKGKASELSDQWSAGLILYEMLTGKNPFFGETLEDVRKKIFKGKIPHINTYGISLPSRIGEAIMRALSPDPDKRYPDVGVFLSELTIKDSVSPPVYIKKKELRGLPYPLTEEQREAIEADANVLVLGGPGTGKTYTLMAKVVHLLKKGVRPENMIVTTFTLRNWSELEKRIGRELGHRVREIILGNFHHVCMIFLKRDIGLLGFGEDFRVIPPNIQAIYMKKACEGTGVDYRYATNRISSYKAKGIDVRMAETIGVSEKVLRVWKKYQEILKNENSLDYDDVILYTMKLFQDEAVTREYRNRFSHILVDEFQDLSPAQISILRQMCGDNNRIFATGDDDQMIYGWRGANLNNIRKFGDGFPPAKVFRLTRSFRLPSSIQRAASNLIRFNLEREEKVVIPRDFNDKSSIIIKQFSKQSGEASFVASEIKKLVKAGYNYSDIAVIYRVNYLSRGLSEAFKKSGIPHSFVGGGFYERKEITGLISVLEYIAYGGKTRLFKALLYPEGGKASRKKTDIDQILKNKEMKKKYQILENIRGASPGITTTIRSVIDFFNVVQYYTDREGGLESLENINEFLKAGEEFEERFPEKSLKKFLEYIQEVSRAGVSGQEGVNLMTVHSAKGLEFPVVFIYALRDGVFPLLRSLSTREELEEERRLMYVAMTRATERLYLTCSVSKNRLSGSDKPSRFLSEIFGQ